MKFLVVLASVVLAIQATTDQELWENFKVEHGRQYRNLREEQVRFAVFQDNLRTIEAHNEKYENGEKSYYMGVNKFTDLSQEEFKTMLRRSKAGKPVSTELKVWHQLSGVEAPSSVNWVSKGVVTPVKDQGDCGSCWTFSSTGALEGAYALKTGSLVSLSEQNLVDCVTESYGCDGGWMQSSFEYVIRNGIESESDYPYKGRDGACQFVSSKSVTKISSYVNVENNENALLDAVANIGPIGIAINADYFQYYAGGIFDEPNCSTDEDSLDHEVLVVGYDTQSNVDYWLVKNSWGQDWGETGYVKIIRGSNQCGLATDAAYPIV